MPAFHQLYTDIPNLPTSVFQARTETSSEAAALPHGEKALTPIIAGTISGTCVGLAWFITLVVILVKRRRRKRWYKEVGRSAEEEAKAKTHDVFIVPPDPAVLLGKRQPGERIIREKKKRWWRRVFVHEEKGNGEARVKSEKGKEKAAQTAEVSGVENAPDGSLPDGSLPNGRGEPPAFNRPPHLNRLSTIMSAGRLHQSPEESPPASDPPNGHGGRNAERHSSASGGTDGINAEEDEHVKTVDFGHESDPESQRQAAADTTFRETPHSYPPGRG
ncbi:hypothetical protein DFH11DRAFT_434355 [Phellopilus nigrolimitatus]|nr:hypothetical protein DFH11DRAFT_434355 [Phellopilus nigrolimitatus]